VPFLLSWEVRVPLQQPPKRRYLSRTAVALLTSDRISRFTRMRALKNVTYVDWRVAHFHKCHPPSALPGLVDSEVSSGRIVREIALSLPQEKVMHGRKCGV
jgi:hypothetical protein